jgi:hypothetical protein
MAVDPDRAKSLFLAASELADPAERAAYLDRECGRQTELRTWIEGLLRVDTASVPVAAPTDVTGMFDPVLLGPTVMAAADFGPDGATATVGDTPRAVPVAGLAPGAEIAETTGSPTLSTLLDFGVTP